MWKAASLPGLINTGSRSKPAIRILPPTFVTEGCVFVVSGNAVDAVADDFRNYENASVKNWYYEVCSSLPILVKVKKHAEYDKLAIISNFIFVNLA